MGGVEDVKRHITGTLPNGDESARHDGASYSRLDSALYARGHIMNETASCAQYELVQQEELLSAKAITVKQPFSSAIVLGFKTVENRSWKLSLPPSGGRWMAVHAGASQATGVEYEPHLRALEAVWPHMKLQRLPTSKILGFFRVCRVVEANSALGQRLSARDAQAKGPYCWLIDRVIKLDSPHAATGQRGLFALPSDLLLPTKPHARCVSPWRPRP